jgi:DNA-binding NarL/FixJ family response regulator
MITVLIADDHAVVRRGIRQILEEASDVEVAGEAGTADEVVRRVEANHYAVIVLDVSLPGGNGIDLIATIRKLRPEARVLILTVHSEAQYAVRAIRAGAAGFLTKDAAPERLLDAVHKLASGGRYVTEEVAEALASTVAGAPGALHEQLSDREFEVMRMLASGKTVSQVADDLSLSVKTVSTHRVRLLKKMNMKTNAELTHYAIKNGLVS